MALPYHTHSDSEASGPPINQLVLAELFSDEYIVVAKTGIDNLGLGTLISPVLTITKALTLVDGTRNRILVFAGEYEEATTLTVPAYNCSLSGIGTDLWGHGVCILAPTAASVSTMVCSLSTGTRVFALNDVAIECHEQEAGVYALHLEVTGDGKLYFTAHNLDIEQHTNYDGLKITATSTDKIEADIEGGNIGGHINCVWGANNDRLRLQSVKCLDGIETSGAFTGKVEAAFCIMRPGANAMTLNHGSNVGEIGCCVGYTGGEVYAEITGITGGVGSGVNGTTAF